MSSPPTLDTPRVRPNYSEIFKKIKYFSLSTVLLEINFNSWERKKIYIFSVSGMRIGSLCLLTLLSLSSSLSQSSNTFSGSLNDKQILDRLVHSQRYDRRIKPDIKPLHVNVSVVLLSLSSPDESSLHYEVEFLLHQTWMDPRSTLILV